MPRKNLIKTSKFPYHIYNRTNDRDFYPIPMNEVWSIYSDAARIISWAFGAKIHALLTMNNHYHLLISTPHENIEDVLQYFQSFISREIRKKSGLKKYRFSGRYRWKCVTTVSYYRNIYRYIAQNPTKEKICFDPAHYPWGTFSGKFGENRLTIPLSHHEFLSGDLQDVDAEYEWINTPLEKDTLMSLEKRLWRQDIGSTPPKVPNGTQKVGGCFAQVLDA